jgi:preprotein translocase subunit SecE
VVDKLKILIAILLVSAGIYAFYYFDQWLQVARVGLLLASIAAAFAVAATSEQGKAGLKFSTKAISEGKKVVWPARPEATQITLIVIAGAIIASLFVWLTDMVLFKVIYGLILGA